MGGPDSDRSHRSSRREGRAGKHPTMVTPMPNADGAGVDSLNTLPSHGRKGNGQGARLVPTVAPWYQQNSEGHLCDITVCPPAADADPF